MEENQDNELLTEFVSESLEGLASIEQDLLALESDGGSDTSLVNRIFRAVHSIKGTGSYLGLEHLVRLSHLAETLLEEIRCGQREATPEVTDAILAAIDGLVGMLNTPDYGAEYNTDEPMGKLNRALGIETSNDTPQAASSTATKAEPLVNVEPVAEEHDAELIADFVSEGIRGLEEVESDLLTLETDGSTDSELVNRIFRAVHTIKGNASYLKLENLVGVAHRAETLLDHIRDGSMPANAVNTDAVLAAVDVLKGMLNTKDLGASFDSSATLAKLDAALSGDTPSTGDSSVSDAGSEISENVLSASDIATIQKNFNDKGSAYRIHLDLAKIQQAVDVKEGVVVAFSSVGRILHASLPLDEIDRKPSGECTLFLESVLEADMLSDHFNLAPNAVERIDVSKLASTSSAGGAPSKKTTAKPTSAKPQTATPQTATPQTETQPASPKPTATSQPSKPKTEVKIPAAKTQPAAQDSHSADNSVGKAAEKEQASKAGTDQSMRVPVHILHKLLEWTGTMVMARNQLMNEYDFSGSTAFRTLSQSISGVHETVIETRMQTTGSLFERYRRVVRDLSRQLGKEVALHIEGGDLELDRTILESFADPLTHLIRNSLDHALETTAEREAAGKNRQGNVYLKSYVHSGEIILAVEDDGRGISADRVCEKAVSKGVISQDTANGLTEHQKVMLIFQPGFSTKDQATDVSGRGVGMDVVRNNIEAVGGTIDVQTKVGSGTTFSAILPLAKALVSSSLTKALIVDIQFERFAIPETAVSEIIQYDEKAKRNILRVDGENVYQLREELVALVDLREALGLTPLGLTPLNGTESKQDVEKSDENACLVILQYRKHLFGAIVDNVLGIQEIIVRGTPKLLQNCSVFTGHTVLGTGRASLILDINGLVTKLKLNFSDKRSKAKTTAKPSTPNAKSSKTTATQRMVLFSYADSEYFAIPLELVAIVERIALDSIRTVGTKEYVQIKNETISVMRLDKFLAISPFNESRNDCCLIRPAAVSYPLGILTGSDVSVIEVDDAFESRMGDDKGIVGTFLYNDKLVMLLDVFSVFEKHAPDKLITQEIQTGSAKILAAEDSLFFRKLIAQYMQHEEWTVEIVNDGQEAWERLQAEPSRFNLVISDINMPRMDGFQLAAKIREDRRFDMLPLVALTTLSDDHFREKGLSIGFDRYVVKIDKNQVRATVAECLKIRRSPTKR